MQAAEKELVVLGWKNWDGRIRRKAGIGLKSHDLSVTVLIRGKCTDANR
jgi:hypothetical protein